MSTVHHRFIEVSQKIYGNNVKLQEQAAETQTLDIIWKLHFS